MFKFLQRKNSVKIIQNTPLRFCSTKNSGPSADNSQIENLKNEKITTTQKKENIEKKSHSLSFFKERYDLHQKQLKHDLNDQGNFSIVEGQNQPYEQDFSGMDREFAQKIKSYEELQQLSPQERKIFYQDVLKVKFPHTKFSERLHSNFKEPAMVPLLTWQLYNWQHYTRGNRPTWTTHDGPSFTSGTPHLGLFYNKTLKDFLNRFKLHLGYKVDFNIGFDCYGTAIENIALNTAKGSEANSSDYKFSERLDTKLMKEDRDFDQKALKVREICRDFVKTSMKSQIEAFMRWGVMHDYRYSYMSLNKNYEANVLETFATLLNRNLVFRGGRPVFFSTKDQRVLAEEEIEEKAAIGPAYLVKFPIKTFGNESKSLESLGNINLLAFVNEPWKLASTQALAINPNTKYALAKDSKKNYFIIALDRLGELSIRLDRKDFSTDLVAPGEALYGIELEHPIFSHITLPVVPDLKVSPSFGTGINIVSPLSCMHDLDLSETYNLSIDSYITKDGLFTGDLHPDLENTNPFKKGNEVITNLLYKQDRVMASYQYEYEYSRIKETKERVLLASIDSWFFRIPDQLRQKCFEELAFCKFRPSLNVKKPEQVDKDYEKLSRSQNEGSGESVGAYYFNVVEELNDFDDWCISEKTYWGVPIPYFYNKLNRKILIDQSIIKHVANIFRQGGSDEWYRLPIRDLLPEEYKDLAPNLVKGDEVFDVWFDNSLTWKSVLVDQINKDSSLSSQEAEIDNALVKLYPEYRTLEDINKEVDEKLPPPPRRGRKSVSRLHQHQKQKKELLEQLKRERDQMIRATDIETFRSIIPDSARWKEKQILDCINNKISADYQKLGINQSFPANCVVEGFDQHSKWFLTSALTSVALTNSLPFNMIKTHGLIYDQDGSKMSKSLGNYVDPLDIIEGTEKLSGKREYGFGADVLRLWCMENNTDEVLTLNNQSIAQSQRMLKYIRYIFKNILGKLDEFDPSEEVDVEELSILDKYTMLKLHEAIEETSQRYQNVEIGNALSMSFVDSSTQFTRLFENSPFVLHEIAKAYMVMLSPIIPFTAQDIYEHMPSYDPRLPCVSQLRWPNIEEKLSINFLRDFSLRDKIDHIIALSDRVSHEIRKLGKPNSQKGKSSIQLNEVDVVFEVKSPDSDEAILLEYLEPELEKIFGVSNVEIGTSYNLSKERPPTPLKSLKQHFHITDYITEEKVKYEINCKVYHCKHPKMKSFPNAKINKCIRCLKFKCTQSQMICLECMSKIQDALKQEQVPEINTQKQQSIE
ncbi:unnamed protein product [Moneuplotes crassus]|uniref:isoleucine--tRNA ligase n=1 Tax=Euplotes crassus TaxID=5936 RepID=A0AAD1U8J6_EUPCR|nr:unnamed protein product [Moneuplotes crassus]